MAVYFIRAGQSGPVKIGHATDVAKRLNAIQCHNYEKLSLLRCIEGGEAREKWLHRHFAGRQVRGEWFAYCDEMLTIEPAVEEVADFEMGTLKLQVSAYLSESGMKLSRFCADSRACYDSMKALLEGRRGGSGPRLQTIQRVRAFMARPQ